MVRFPDITTYSKIYIFFNNKKKKKKLSIIISMQCTNAMYIKKMEVRFFFY